MVFISMIYDKIPLARTIKLGRLERKTTVMKSDNEEWYVSR